VKKRLTLIAFAYFVWIMINIVPANNASGWIQANWQQLVLGLFASIFVVFLTADLFIKSPAILRHPIRCWYFVAYYLPTFIWEMTKANIDVAYRILHPALPINPGIVKVKTNLKSDTAVTLLANSITLTPGTLSVDINDDEGYLYVHWIDVRSKDVEAATKDIVERFEKILQRIFE